tara:strand:+ start:36 stop:449 length:414 start_codon:yes stop_codon:yes gene_type:complete
MKQGYDVITSAKQTSSIVNQSSDTLDFDFPTVEGRADTSPQTIGNFAINVRNDSASGTDEALAISIFPILSDPDDRSDIIAANNEVVLNADLDFTTGLTYHYPVTDPIGPCKGVRVVLDQAAMDAGTRAYSVWMTSQ